MSIHTEFEYVWESIQDGNSTKHQLEGDGVYLTVIVEGIGNEYRSSWMFFLAMLHDAFGWDFPSETDNENRIAHITIGKKGEPVTDRSNVEVQHLLATVLAVTDSDTDPIYENGEVQVDAVVGDSKSSDSEENPHGNMKDNADISECPMFS